MKRNDEAAAMRGGRHVDENEAILLGAFARCAKRDRGNMQVFCCELAKVSGLDWPHPDQVYPLVYYLGVLGFPKYAIRRALRILERAASQPEETGASDGAVIPFPGQEGGAR